MHDHTKPATSDHMDQLTHVGTEGEFAGWRTYFGDNYEAHTGPFWYRQEPDGSMRCAFRVKEKHLNTSRHVHGGCFLSFADYCLFVIAKPVLQGPGVTIAMACEFIDSAGEGDLIVGTGEIIRAGGSLIFLRGQLRTGERTLFTFSATIKRVKQKGLSQPSA
ncbi:PaaI family thioesterase [Bradyrhizobium sp. ORS 86]|uniref:PaaI family thioesterase n=1 Tax=Bradyrhizobium sp. ORS 86 TaxID=1685970 RepID=UPI00388E0AE3